MNIADKKVELIEWIASLKDHTLLEKIEQLKQQSISEAYQANLKPMTPKQYKARLDQAEADYQQGNVISQEEIEKESENW